MTSASSPGQHHPDRSQRPTVTCIPHTSLGLPAGDAKDAIFMLRVHHGGVAPCPGSVRYVQAVRSARLATAKMLGVKPDEAAVFEDVLSGVASGRAGRFGFVVGVDRVGPADELRAHGADRVVTDLAHLSDTG